MKKPRIFQDLQLDDRAPLTVPARLTLEDIRKMPKVDIHNHLDGALPAKVVWKVAKKFGLTIPDAPDGKRETFDSFYPNPGPYDFTKPEVFNEFLALFRTTLTVMQSPASARMATYETLRDLARQNVMYTEFRYAPSYHTPEGIPPFVKHPDPENGATMERIALAILKALDDAEQDFGIKSNLTFCIPREIHEEAKKGNYHGPSAEEIVDVAISLQDRGVVGIDLACNEVAYGPEPYIPVYRRIINSKLKSTVHAGEAGPDRKRNILIALDDMGVNRIGHATPLMEMPLARRIINREGIGIERNPMSNRMTMLSSPTFNDFAELLREGLLMTINSDDAGVFGPECSIAKNIYNVARECMLSTREALQTQLNAIQVAFLGDEEKEALRQEYLLRLAQTQF